MADKLFERRLVREILRFLEPRDALVVYGARQVGKTSLLKYLMKNHLKENVFYFDLEFRNLLDLCNEGAEAVYSYLLQKGADDKKRIFLLLDEVQYLENPSSLIKIFHDHYPNVKLIVSGSSSFEIRKKFKESLAGRIIAFELYPLSFEEFLLFKEKSYRLLEENPKAINDELIPLAEELIKFGGFPKIVLEKEEEKKQTFLSQIINTYVRKDIRDIGNVRDLSSFNKLLEALASQSAQILNVSELSSTLQINRKTLMGYLDLLEHTFIIKRVRPFHKNLRSELSKNSKVFLTDTGMLHLLWLKEFPKVVLGNVFETFAFLELMKAGKKINFWRTKGGREIDFIIAEKGLFAIEAKYNFENADKKNLDLFLKKYECRGTITGLKGEKKGKYIWELVKELENKSVGLLQ